MIAQFQRHVAEGDVNAVAGTIQQIVRQNVSSCQPDIRPASCDLGLRLSRNGQLCQEQ
jgi:hypothetical protein